LPNLVGLLISISHPVGKLGTVSSTRARDEGLRRISTITRWVAAIGVTGTAVLAGFVYRVSPGRASTTSAPASAPSVETSPADGGTGSVDPNAGFQAPAAVPAPVQQAPVVRSGAS
jgi:hypothetical protein